MRSTNTHVHWGIVDLTWTLSFRSLALKLLGTVLISSKQILMLLNTLKNTIIHIKYVPENSED